MSHRFLQIHTLTSYPAALLNRDDVGFAKRVPFGGVSRTRISSQCLKRHWRVFTGENALSDAGAAASIRSRYTFDHYIYRPLVAEQVAEDLAREVTQELMNAVLGESAKAKKAKKESKDEAAPKAKAESLRTSQITVLGRPEVDFLLDEARAIAAEAQGQGEVKKAVAKALKARLTTERKKNLKALRCAAGLDGALFGRMVTSDILARGDAAIHVAHALTVHGEAAESDYFSAVDDLLQDEEESQLGSAHIGSTELTSGLYYGYIVVDIPLLVSNLEGCKREAWQEADRTVAAEVVKRLVTTVATVSPGAKLGSTAPYSYAHLLLTESGNTQPRTLANAFLKPVAERPDLIANTYDALSTYLADSDRMYGNGNQRALAAMGPVDHLPEEVVSGPIPLAEVAAQAANQVRGA